MVTKKTTKTTKAATTAEAKATGKNVSDLLKLRAQMKARRPTWVRQQADQFPRLRRQKRVWRRPKGIHSKIRQRHKGRFMPSPSYGAPAAVRGLHPSGLEERLVNNLAELNGADPKSHAIRISARVGMRKKIQMMEAAKKAGFRVLNPAVVQKALKVKEAKPEEKKESGTKVEEKKE